eukprot:g48223.t1
MPKKKKKSLSKRKLRELPSTESKFVPLSQRHVEEASPEQIQGSLVSISVVPDPEEVIRASCQVLERAVQLPAEAVNDLLHLDILFHSREVYDALDDLSMTLAGKVGITSMLNFLRNRSNPCRRAVARDLKTAFDESEPKFELKERSACLEQLGELLQSPDQDPEIMACLVSATTGCLVPLIKSGNPPQQNEVTTMLVLLADCFRKNLVDRAGLWVKYLFDMSYKINPKLPWEWFLSIIKEEPLVCVGISFCKCCQPAKPSCYWQFLKNVALKERLDAVLEFAQGGSADPVEVVRQASEGIELVTQQETLTSFDHRTPDKLQGVQTSLLRVRARALESLSRFDEALSDYVALNRIFLACDNELVLELARCAISAGKPAIAKTTLQATLAEKTGESQSLAKMRQMLASLSVELASSECKAIPIQRTVFDSSRSLVGEIGFIDEQLGDKHEETRVGILPQSDLVVLQVRGNVFLWKFSKNHLAHIIDLEDERYSFGHVALVTDGSPNSVPSQGPAFHFGTVGYYAVVHLKPLLDREGETNGFHEAACVVEYKAVWEYAVNENGDRIAYNDGKSSSVHVAKMVRPTSKFSGSCLPLHVLKGHTRRIQLIRFVQKTPNHIVTCG